ncbi:MAG: hypothetical protein P4L51_11010 [Puia sp.]|nr:hypothetical protein [Puia sp.]
MFFLLISLAILSIVLMSYCAAVVFCYILPFVVLGFIICAFIFNFIVIPTMLDSLFESLGRPLLIISAILLVLYLLNRYSSSRSAFISSRTITIKSTSHRSRGSDAWRNRP